MSRFDVLQEIGLSKTGIRCYACLLEHGPLETRELAKRLRLPQSNLYGVLARLDRQGFISKFKMTTQPALFKAWPLNQALWKHYLYQRRCVLSLCTELGLPPPPAPTPFAKHKPGGIMKA